MHRSRVRKDIYISKSNITVAFKKTVSIKNMIYQAYSTSTEVGIGFPEELQIYYSTESGQNTKIKLLQNVKATATDKKIVYNFNSIIKCNQINIEWKTIHSSKSIRKKRDTGKEIIFLYRETTNLNEIILNAFDKTDYKQLTLTKAFNNLNN